MEPCYRHPKRKVKIPCNFCGVYACRLCAISLRQLPVPPGTPFGDWDYVRACYGMTNTDRICHSCLKEKVAEFGLSDLEVKLVCGWEAARLEPTYKTPLTECQKGDGTRIVYGVVIPHWIQVEKVPWGEGWKYKFSSTQLPRYYLSLTEHGLTREGGKNLVEKIIEKLRTELAKWE